MESVSTAEKAFRIACLFSGVILLVQGVWVATPLYWMVAAGKGGLGPWSEAQTTYLWRVICGGWIGVCGWAYLVGWAGKTEVLLLLALFHLYVIIAVIAYFAGGGDEKVFALLVGVPHAMILPLPISRLWRL